MTPSQFFSLAIPAAIQGGHIWPDYAACEAAEESTHRDDPSNWALSKLAIQGNNLFGMKAPSHPPEGWAYPTLDLPTYEVVGGEEVAVAHQFWPIFPDWATAFKERMALLRRLSVYAPALAASSGPAFVVAVSKVWATDPNRAANVLAIMADNAVLVGSIMKAAEGAATLVSSGSIS
ncbi:MAG: glucosaminidase domain-containing protein [Patescibacteria group bacterium]|nr:glucosaminidase domain-containing protein [Patescibacteria group bacterium]